MSEDQHTVQEQITAPQQQVQPPETELEAGQQQARTLFSETPAPSFVLNAQGRVEDANVAGCGLLGQTREALLGRRWGYLLAPESQAAFGALLAQAFETRLRLRGEARLPASEGPPHDVLLDLAAYETQDRLDHALLVVTDITPYKQAHLKLLDITAAQERQLQEQAARIRALNQELEGVVTTFIRQLDPPVARALNFLGLLRRPLGGAPEEVARPLTNAERSVQQIVALLRTVQRYLAMRRLPAQVRSVDLGRVWREVVKDAQPLLVDRDVQITSDSLPTVQGDSQALYVIFNEYLSNALKFTRRRDQAHIHLRVRETGSEYHLGLRDNGVGFDMRQKDKLFQLFGRLHPSSVYEGTGVGLTGARRLAERFGGRVWAEGKVDGGATFWLAWPKTPHVSP